MTESFRSGLIAIIGRPNVGKSTLLNRLVGEKVSITSRRTQTTRHRILGIKTQPSAQLVFVDTPGLQTQQKTAMNQYMNKAARASLEGVDCVLLLIGARGWQPGDEYPLRCVSRDPHTPIILVINKIDELKDRGKLLPLIEASAAKAAFADIVPVSARTGDNIGDLEKVIVRHLPEQAAAFAPEQRTDRGERFLAAELVREQIFRGYGQEIPYATAVEIERFQHEKKLLRVEAAIWVEKEGQKAILIGKNGERLKDIGQRARIAMEKRFGVKVYLGLWVKVREGWSDDLRALRSLGYMEE